MFHQCLLLLDEKHCDPMDNLLLRVLHQSSHLIHNHHISNELHSKQIMMHNVSGLCCTHRGKAANAHVHINTLGDHSLLMLINNWYRHNHNSVTDSRLTLVRGSQYLLMCVPSPHLTHKQASTKNQGMAKQRTRIQAASNNAYCVLQSDHITKQHQNACLLVSAMARSRQEVWE